MSARLPRGKGPNLGVGHSTDEYKKQRSNTTTTRTVTTRQTSQPASDHPWSGLGEILLRPLPPEWRYNIQKTFSAIGDAIGNLLNPQGRTTMGRGRRGF